MKAAIGFIVFCVSISICITGCRQSGLVADKLDSVDYNIHIRPILSDRCFKCHGPDANQRKSNLRLDTREGALIASALLVQSLFLLSCQVQGYYSLTSFIKWNLNRMQNAKQAQ